MSSVSPGKGTSNEKEPSVCLTSGKDFDQLSKVPVRITSCGPAGL